MPTVFSGSLQAKHGAPRDFVPYYPTVPSLRAVYAAPMASAENGGLEVRYANLNPADSEAGVALERSPLCRAPNFKKLGEDHKRRVARLVNKERVLVGIVQMGVVDFGEKATMT